MNFVTIESRLLSYLEKAWSLSDIEPFLLVYIELLLLFREEISPTAASAILERQKQLRGEQFDGETINELRFASRKQLDDDLRTSNDETRAAMLNRMLFCALLDTKENDFFYLTEPIFEFAQKMGVSPSDLSRILESKFSGLKING